jgi:hypothetical protein
MKEIVPQYPWCTGVPRPTLVANMDAEEVIIFYYTAPVCEPRCKSAIIKLKGTVSLESHYVNDEQNAYLQSGCKRDVIYMQQGVGGNDYLFLFHNEWIRVKALSFEELPGEESLMESLIKHQNPDFDRD